MKWFCRDLYILVWLIQYQERSLQWRHNEHNGVSNHQPHDCLLDCLFRHRSKQTSKLHITGLCAGNSPVTGEFLAQRANNVENVSIWWHHHVCRNLYILTWFISTKVEWMSDLKLTIDTPLLAFNTLRSKQNGRHFTDDIFNAFSWEKIFKLW